MDIKSLPQRSIKTNNISKVHHDDQCTVWINSNLEPKERAADTDIMSILL